MRLTWGEELDTRLSGPTDTSESPPAQPRTPRYASGLPVRRLGGRRSSDDSFETLLDAFTRHLTEVEYRSGATGHTYAKWVRNFHQWLQMAHPGLGLEAATAEVLQEFLACKRGQRVKGSTLATILHSLRSFYSFTLAGDPTRSNPTLGSGHRAQSPLRSTPTANQKSATSSRWRRNMSTPVTDAAGWVTSRSPSWPELASATGNS